jgi:hypothetical protein
MSPISSPKVPLKLRELGAWLLGHEAQMVYLPGAQALPERPQLEQIAHGFYGRFLGIEQKPVYRFLVAHDPFCSLNEKARTTGCRAGGRL